MANTNMEVIPKSKKDFNQRKYENNRTKNIPTMANEDYINVVEIINEEVGKTILAKKLQPMLNEDNQKTRTQLTKKLNVYESRMKKYSNDMMLNPSQKKFEVLQKLQIQINELRFERDNTKKQMNNKHKNRNDYFEFRFSITNPPFELRRNQNYGNDLKTITKDFINNFLKLDITIHSYSLHMDQQSPHVHMLGLMENKTFNQQMNDMYGKSFNLHSLQNDWNNFVRNHDLFKKYDLELNHITRGGAHEDYKNLQQYKETQKLEKHYNDIKEKYDLLTNDLEKYIDMDNLDLIEEHNDLINFIKHKNLYTIDFQKEFNHFRNNQKDFDVFSLYKKTISYDIRDEIRNNEKIKYVLDFIKTQNLSKEMAIANLEGMEYTIKKVSQNGTKSITKTLSKEDIEILIEDIDR